MLGFDSLSIQWPYAFWVFLLLPICGLIYWRMFQPAKWLSNQGSIYKNAKRWQYAHAFFIFVGLCCLFFALTRPRAILYIPSRLDTIMLAIDTSGSMRADDIKPSRIDAAISAIKDFINAQPPQVRIGIVTIASTAALRQAPTTERLDLLQALENIPLQPGSALGSGIVIALANLLPGSGIDAEKIITEADGGTKTSPSTQPLGKSNQINLEPGSNRSMAIVLITDGQSNMGPDVLKMAELAANHGVKIHTVGVGTEEGTVIKSQGISMRVRLDETLLKKIANATQGEYYKATSNTELKRIYESLGLTIRFEKQQLTEITSPVMALGLLCILLGCLLSLHRFGRVV